MTRGMIVTGTRKGIGRAIAEHYLEQGWRVAGCSRKSTTLDHPDYLHFELDVCDDRAVADMVRRVNRKWGRLDALVNNAGIGAMNHLLLTPSATAQSVLATNVLGAFHFLRETGKVMSRKEGGRVVNFSTVAVPLQLEGEAIYAASKAAVETLTKVAARELAQFKITVNAVGPTPVDTDLIRLVPKDKIDTLINRQAIRRLGEFRDVINVIDFFLDERSDFITGQVIYLGGVNG